MARVVVLSFTDNLAAEAFVKLLDEAQSNEYPNIIGMTLQEMGLILASGAKTEALLPRPTLPSCTCEPDYHLRGNQKNWYKTKRFGWFVCPRCRRPAKEVIQNYIKNLAVTGGNDLLAELRAEESPVDEPVDS